MEGIIVPKHNKHDHLSQLILKCNHPQTPPQSPIPSDTNIYHLTHHHNNNVDYSSTTEDEQDTANTLILLSQAPFASPSPSPSPSPGTEEEELGCKFSSKRYIETTTAGMEGVGMYVYECKTCNRTFPSFQALGGHRASHKKPKQVIMMRSRPMEDDEEQEQLKHNRMMMMMNNSNSNIGLEYLGNNNKVKKKKKKKGSSAGGGGCNKVVHECGTCGAEFTSGQALGGHMRRHRNPNTNPPLSISNTTFFSFTPTINTTPTSMPLQPISAIHFDYDNNNNNKKKKSGILYLDLNQPASPDHRDDEEEEAEFVSNQQQQQQSPPLVLPAAPTLVDCHY